VLDRLTRYARRLAHLPTTVAVIDEAVKRVESRLSTVETGHTAAPAAPHANEVRESVAAPSVNDYPSLSAEHVAGARLYANRVDALCEVPTNGCIAEVGVAAGDFTETLLRELTPRRFDAYDIFLLHHEPHLWGRSTEEWFGGRTHREFYEWRFAHEIKAGTLGIFEGDSSTRLAERPSPHYDMIYIDGDHSLDGVRRDTEASIPRLTDDGLLVFNDYIMMDHMTIAPYGIVPVVNDLCANQGWNVAYFALQHGLFCDIALKRQS
jgi:hypothetical protein